MKYYKPDGMSIWDTWCVKSGETSHLYYLQYWEPDSKRPQVDGDFLGHAVSSDLINWKECDYALGPNVDGTDDDMQPWTGCTVYHESRFYMFYTMRSKKDSATKQKIGLAISEDGYNFKRYKDNPVIVPDSKWYVNNTNYCGCIDCRDLIVIRHSDYWLGYFAARVHGKSPIETAAIACAKSYDLIHWEQLPPVFVPKKYNCIEVPDVFFLNGKWYLTALTGHHYGNRGQFTDSKCFNGTIYAVSDGPLGPFKELDTNVLIGGYITCGYSCRSVLFNGRRYVMFTQKPPNGSHLNAVLSHPYLLDTDNENHLVLRYPSDLMSKKDDNIVFYPPRLVCAHGAWNAYSGEWTCDGNIFKGKAELGWQVAHVLDGSMAMEIEADVTIKSGISAGIVIRTDRDNGTAMADCAVILDTVDKKIAFVEMGSFNYYHSRDFNAKVGKTYHLHIVKNGEHIDVYIDNILYIQTALAFNPNGNFGIGVMVDRGETVIKFTRVYKDI